MDIAITLFALLGCTRVHHAGTGGTPRGGADGHAPTGLPFSFSPINSVRGEVAAHEGAGNGCVRAIWDYSNNDKSNGKHCDDFGTSFPYVFVSSGACDTAVHYAGNVDMVSAT